MQQTRLPSSFVFKWIYPGVIAAVFLVFFRAKWAFSGGGFDESCYLQYVHHLVGLAYPTCYSQSHFPGIALLWAPAALFSRFLSAASYPITATQWLVPMVALESFLCWGLALYLIARVQEKYIGQLTGFSRSYLWPILFLLSVPVLSYSVRETHLVHSGEFVISLLALLMLVEKRYLLATVFITWLSAIRLNDIPMFAMLLGALLDNYSRETRQKLDNKKRLRSNQPWKLNTLFWSIGVLGTALAVLVFRIAFITGYHHIFLWDLLKTLDLHAIFNVIFSPNLGIAWFAPSWLFLIVLSTIHWKKLSGLSKGAVVWSVLAFLFHSAHAAWWKKDPQQIRYLIGTYAGVLILVFELLPQCSRWVRNLFLSLMVIGALTLTLYNFVGADINSGTLILSGKIWSNHTRYFAYDGSSYPLFYRKFILEPLGTAPLGFSVFSWVSKLGLLNPFQNFQSYALRGVSLWLSTFVTVGSLSYLLGLLYFLPNVFRKALGTTTPDFMKNRSTLMPDSEASHGEFRYPISQNKVAELLRLKEKIGDKFPKVGIFVVSYNASSLLVETLNRIPQSLIPLLHEIFAFDDFSQDDTYELARELGLHSKWQGKFFAFKNLRNLGYGGNQKLGFRYAIEKGLDQVVLLHGDGQYAPELLPDLLYESIIQNKKVVFGSRMMDGLSALKGGMPLYKWIGNKILTHIENFILNLNLTEFHSGYRLYSTEVLRLLPFELNTNNFHFDTQIIIQCRAAGAEIVEIPIPTYYGNEICRVNGMKYALDVVISVFKYRLHQLGILFQSRYQIQESVTYGFKSSPYSSHGQILKIINPNCEVLDVGCGPGLLSQKLSQKGVKSTGIDFEIQKNVWSGFDSYIQDDLEKAEKLPKRRTFDCIILADVLEHLRNPSDLTRKVRPLLKTDGKLIASTGNVALWYMRLSLLLGRFNYGKKGILDETHVHLYTLDSFERLITQCGYQVDKVKVTSLPFEVVFKSTGKNQLLKLADWTYYQLACLWPKLFAYQFVIEASVKNLETAQSEGRIQPSSGAVDRSQVDRTAA